MKKVLGLLVTLTGSAVAAMAFEPAVVPEINPAVIPTAVALIGGGILVARSYFKK